MIVDGEAVALKGGQYPVTVEAVQDSVLMQVETRVVFDTLRSDPDLAVAMLSSTFSHLHELVMEIDLYPGRKLARASAETVLEGLEKRGFYLQMPPVDRPGEARVH